MDFLIFRKLHRNPLRYIFLLSTGKLILMKYIDQLNENNVPTCNVFKGFQTWGGTTGYEDCMLIVYPYHN